MSRPYNVSGYNGHAIPIPGLNGIRIGVPRYDAMFEERDHLVARVIELGSEIREQTKVIKLAQKADEQAQIDAYVNGKDDPLPTVPAAEGQKERLETEQRTCQYRTIQLENEIYDAIAADSDVAAEAEAVLHGACGEADRAVSAVIAPVDAWSEAATNLEMLRLILDGKVPRGKGRHTPKTTRLAQEQASRLYGTVVDAVGDTFGPQEGFGPTLAEKIAHRKAVAERTGETLPESGNYAAVAKVAPDA